MPTVEEALANASEIDYLDDEIQYIIDENLRTIAIPSNGVVLGVQGDRNVNRVNFQMVRYYNGFDMSQFAFRINYKNANGDSNFYEVNDMTVRDDKIYFTWLVDAIAAAYVGKVQFVVRIFRIVESKEVQNFYTTSNYADVLEGLFVDEQMPEEELKSWESELKEKLEEDLNKKLEEDLDGKLAGYTEEERKAWEAEIQAKLEENLKKQLEEYAKEIVAPIINNYVSNNGAGAGYVKGTWEPIPYTVLAHGEITDSVGCGYYIRIENLVYIDGWIIDVLSQLDFSKTVRIKGLPFKIALQKDLFSASGTDVFQPSITVSYADGKIIPCEYLPSIHDNGLDNPPIDVLEISDVYFNSQNFRKIHIFGCYMTDDEVEFPKTNTIGTATTISNVYCSVSDITDESKTITITEVIE